MKEKEMEENVVPAFSCQGTLRILKIELTESR
jgi:hypothetical protein